MSYIDEFGREVVDSVPFEPAVPVRRRSMSVADMVRQEIMKYRMQNDDEIRTEDDLIEDMSDYDMPAFDDDLVAPSPFEIDDSVPNKIVKEKKDASQKDPAPVREVPTKESTPADDKETA